MYIFVTWTEIKLTEIFKDYLKVHQFGTDEVSWEEGLYESVLFRNILMIKYFHNLCNPLPIYVVDQSAAVGNVTVESGKWELDHLWRHRVR